jgi:hypothetical protein
MELLKHSSDPLQLLLNGGKQLMIFSIGFLLNQFQFHLFVFQSLQIADFLLRTRNGKPFLVEKFFNLQDEIQILPPVESLEGSSFMGFNYLKFRLPVTKHMGFEAGDPAHLSDPVIEPIVGDGILVFPTFKQPCQSSSLRFALSFIDESSPTTHSDPFDEASWRLRAPLKTWLGLNVKILLEEISISSPV